MTPGRSYLRFILAPFFRWWWALITGVATLLSYVLTPQTGLPLSSVGVLVVTLTFFTLLFLTISVLTQAWVLFRDRYADLTVHSIQKNRDFEADWIFVLDGNLSFAPGTVLDVHRKLGDVEVPFAMLEIRTTTALGRYQTTPLWLSPAHIADYTAGKFSVADLVVQPHIQLSRIREVASAIK